MKAQMMVVLEIDAPEDLENISANDAQLEFAKATMPGADTPFAVLGFVAEDGTQIDMEGR